ncbi:MAG: hypothetical protein PHQ50_01460 [Eubacteriales bacterium]|nr:hypothetical protein [Eubacteriales bacterium]MDD3350012.1 hypothetical protein [Eubacteriales bacterium]
MNYILYGLLLVGVFIAVKPFLMYLMPTRLLDTEKLNVFENTKLFRHVRSMMEALNATQADEKIRKKTMLLIGVSGIISLISLTFSIACGFGGLGILLCLFFTLLPYASCRIKLLNQQISGSYEGEILITEILNQYKINHQNIKEAIDISIGCLDKTPVSKKLLFRLSLRLKTCRTENELREILDTFAESSGTEWAKMLALNIFYAVSEDTSISAGLEDLLKECEHAGKMIEHSKRQNNEAFVMLKFLAPAFYVGLMWSLHKYFEMSYPEIILFQFNTSMGALIFFSAVVLTFICGAMASVAKRPKFDI